MLKRYIPIVIVVAALIVYETSSRSGGPAPEGLSTASVGAAGPEAPEAVPDAVSAATEGAISRGTPFFVEMQRAGIAPVDIQAIVTSSRDVFNFKRVQPGQKYALFTDASGALDSLHFVIDNERILKVNQDAGGFVARLDTVAYATEHYVTSGTIHSSIYESLQGQGANPELAAYLAVIFQWDIDFFTDIRKGDTYTILYENKVYPDGNVTLGNVLAARIFTRGEEHYAVRYTDKEGRRSYYDTRGNSLQKSLLRAPLRYQRISSNFSHKRLHPVTHTYRPHLGVDYVAPVGTPVRSTGDGTVVEAARNRANGNYVKIKHNRRYTTYYLHLKSFAKGIRGGTRVRQGQVIGYLGSTGLVTAPHLDYRIKVGSRFVNPRTIKLPSREPVPADERALFEVTRDACLVRFFEAIPQTETKLVEAPRPPLQQRIAAAF